MRKSFGVDDWLMVVTQVWPLGHSFDMSIANDGQMKLINLDIL